MARTDVTTQPVTRDGLAPATSEPTTEGDVVDCGHTLLWVDNTTAGPVQVTVEATHRQDGLDVEDLVVSVAAGTIGLIGPLPAPTFARTAGTVDAGRAYVNYDVTTGVNRAVLRVVSTSTSAVPLSEALDLDSRYARLAVVNEFGESQTLESSFDGGESDFDSTSRLTTESYQRATSQEPYGEIMRAILQRQNAKAMIAWHENYSGHVDAPRTVAWIGAHGEANDGLSWHNHLSIEVPDENGAMQSALEIPFAPWDEPNGYGIAQTDRYIRAIAKLIASTFLAVEGPEGSTRRLDFSTADDSNVGGKNEFRRWSIMVTNDAETGGDAGSDFRIVRRDDLGNVIDYPIHINRDNGYVGIWTGGTEPQSRFHVGSHAQISGNLTLDGAFVTIASGTTYRFQGSTDRDIEFSDAAAGPVLTDRTDGSQYRLFVDNGALSVEQLP